MNLAKRIDRFLHQHGSPLAGYGNAFVQQGRRYGVSPMLMVAIAGAESSFGKISSGSHNAWGWGPGIDFPSWDAGISAIAKGLRSGYLNEGRKSVTQIGAKWAPSHASNDPTNLNSNWVKNVNGFLHQLGGAATMPSGGSQTASPATGGANVGSPMGGSGGGFADMVLQSNEAIAAGEKPSPLKTLDALVQGLAASGGSSGAPTATGGGRAKPNDVSAPAGRGITFHGQKLTHDTDGLPGYPAVDLFAKPGTPFLAPENGRVVRLSGRGGTSGNVFGYSVYFQGDSGKTYFITHLGPSRPRVNARVRRGRPLGRVSPWQSGSPHAHVGIHG